MRKLLSFALISLLLSVCMFSSVLHAKDSHILSKWKERARLAETRLVALSKSAERDICCRYMCHLEMAFVRFLNLKKNPDVFTSKGDAEVYRMVIDCNEKGLKDCFEISFTYNRDTGKLMSYKVEKIPSGWMLVTYTTNKKALGLIDKAGNSIAINLGDPLASYVAAAK